MQSIQDYQTLKTAAGDQLGCSLPQMQAAPLYWRTLRLCRTELAASLAALALKEGWYLTRDQLVLGIPAQSDVLIEGEWVTDTLSVRLKLLSEETYQLTCFSLEPFAGSQPQHDTAYHEQALYLRPPLMTKGPDLGIYRLWWRLGSHADGPQEGRWLPVAQQFVGFDRSKER